MYKYGCRPKADISIKIRKVHDGIYLDVLYLGSDISFYF